MGDVAVAPYMDRMCVLKKYRDFEVPKEEAYTKWHTWTSNILTHSAVKETQQPRDKLLKAYKRYADCTARTGHFYTYYARPENTPEWLKPDKDINDPYTEPDWITNDKEEMANRKAAEDELQADMDEELAKSKKGI